MTNGGTPRLPTATGFAARRAVAALRSHDIDPAPLLERLDLSEPAVNTDQIRVSAAAQAKFLELAAEALNDPALGLHLAMNVNPREVGLLFYVASAGKDLGEAIALFARYCRIVNEAVRVQLTRRGTDLVVEVHLVGVTRFRATQNAEFGIAMIVEESARDYRPEGSPDEHYTRPHEKLERPGVRAVLRLSGRVWRIFRSTRFFTPKPRGAPHYRGCALAGHPSTHLRRGGQTARNGAGQLTRSG